jgi:CheY-like chemotaxis protein
VNGLECLKELKKDDLLKHVPVVICTTSNLDLDSDSYEGDGCHQDGQVQYKNAILL